MSPSALAVSSSANLLLVLCLVRYNKFKVFSSRFCLSILPNIDPVSPNRHTIHYFCCCFCFQLSCWSITQLYFLSCCASIHPLPVPEPSVRVLCCAFIDAPDMVCASYRLTLGMCILFWLLGWNFHPFWLTPYPHEDHTRGYCLV